MARKRAAGSSLTEEQKTAYYDALRQSKVKAGLTVEQAIEVVARQREEDDATGAELELEVPEETPKA